MSTRAPPGRAAASRGGHSGRSKPNRRHPAHEKVPQSPVIQRLSRGATLAGADWACVKDFALKFVNKTSFPEPVMSPSVAFPALGPAVLRSRRRRAPRPGFAGGRPAAEAAGQAARRGAPAAEGSGGRHRERPAHPLVGPRGGPAVAAATIPQHAAAGGLPGPARPADRQQAGRPGEQEEQGQRRSGVQEAHGLRRGPGAAGLLDPARDRPAGHAGEAPEALRGAPEGDAAGRGGEGPPHPRGHRGTRRRP